MYAQLFRFNPKSIEQIRFATNLHWLAAFVPRLERYAIFNFLIVEPVLEGIAGLGVNSEGVAGLYLRHPSTYSDNIEHSCTACLPVRRLQQPKSLLARRPKPMLPINDRLSAANR